MGWWWSRGRFILLNVICWNVFALTTFPFLAIDWFWIRKFLKDIFQILREIIYEEFVKWGFTQKILFHFFRQIKLQNVVFEKLFLVKIEEVKLCYFHTVFSNPIL